MFHDLHTAIMPRLAAAFAREVRNTLTEAQLADVNRTNAPDSPICATHVYCDANDLMISAFAEVVGRDPHSAASQEENPALTDADLQADANMMNEAWSLARAAHFNPRHIKTGTAEFSADLAIPADLEMALWETAHSDFDIYRFTGDADRADGPWRYLTVDKPGVPDRFTVSIESADNGYEGNLYCGGDFNDALRVMRDPCATIVPE